MSEKSWCEHHYESDCHGIDMIRMPSGQDLAWGGLHHPDHFSFCPICGAKRPEERKSLAQKLSEDCAPDGIGCQEWKDYHSLSNKTWERVAQAALVHFLEVVESITSPYSKFTGWIDPVVLKDAMRKSVEEPK